MTDPLSQVADRTGRTRLLAIPLTSTRERPFSIAGLSPPVSTGTPVEGKCAIYRLVLAAPWWR